MPSSRQCEVCFKTFVKTGELNRHRKIHNKNEHYRCSYDFCGKTFAQRSALNTHMNTHSGAKPHKCKHCDVHFGDPSSRSRHEKERHGGLPPLPCGINGCKSKIRRHTAFRTHVRKVHHQTAEEAFEHCRKVILSQKATNTDTDRSPNLVRAIELPYLLAPTPSLSVPVSPAVLSRSISPNYAPGYMAQSIWSTLTHPHASPASLSSHSTSMSSTDSPGPCTPSPLPTNPIFPNSIKSHNQCDHDFTFTRLPSSQYKSSPLAGPTNWQLTYSLPSVYSIS